MFNLGKKKKKEDYDYLVSKWWGASFGLYDFLFFLDFHTQKLKSDLFSFSVWTENILKELSGNLFIKCVKTCSSHPRLYLNIKSLTWEVKSYSLSLSLFFFGPHLPSFKFVLFLEIFLLISLTYLFKKLGIKCIV